MPTKIKNTHHPHGMVRLGFRLPIWLFRLHLGWLLGGRFLLLTHKGRTSGKLHQTVLEVLQHDQIHDTYAVFSGWGEQSDWVIHHFERLFLAVGAFPMIGIYND